MYQFCFTITSAIDATVELKAVGPLENLLKFKKEAESIAALFKGARIEQLVITSLEAI